MGDPARDRLSSLPPSAKLVYYVLEKHDRLDQSALAAETRLSARTVRFAIDKLDDANLVEDGVCPTDARRSVYKPASETESSTEREAETEREVDPERESESAREADPEREADRVVSDVAVEN